MAKFKQPDDDVDDDRPWDEERWEAFMRESDLRAARFGEILETVRDEPDRDRIVAKEMGWTWIEEALDEQEAARAAGEAGGGEEEEWDKGEDADVDDEADAEATADGGPESETDAAPVPRRRRSIRDPLDDEDGTGEIVAYRLAFDVGMKVDEALQPYMKAEAGTGDEEYERRLGEAYIGVHIAAAKIAGGHAMGYEDDVLCGNIANCKRGLVGAESAEQALLELKAAGSLPADVVDVLLPDVRAVIEAVKARIEELRKRVWW